MARNLILPWPLLGFVCLVAQPGRAVADQGGAYVVPARPAVPHALPPWRSLQAAARPVPVQAENRPGGGRLLFQFAHGTAYTMMHDGDTVTLRFQTPAVIGEATNLPHDITRFTGGIGQAQIALAPGRRVRASVVGATVVLDVLDPDQAGEPAASRADAAPAQSAKPAPPAPPAATMSPPPGFLTPPPMATARTTTAPPPDPAPPDPAPPVTAPVEPVQATKLPPPAQPDPDKAAEIASVPPAPSPAPSASPATPPPQAAADANAAEPVSLAITRVALAPDSADAAGGGAAIVVPFDRGVGLAAFRRGDIAMVVFDQRQPIDVAGLRGDPVFAAAAIKVLPAATVLRFTLAAGARLRAARVAEGWRLWVGPNAAPLTPVATVIADDRLLLNASAPGMSVVVPDETTGGTLLVGTQTEAGQGMPVARHTAVFSLLPTAQGVAVEPLSDRLVLRVVEAGFTLSAGDGGALPLSPGGAASVALADAATLTRRFDFAALPGPMLLRRLQSAIAAAGAQPPLARLRPRFEAAQTMISLGLAAEAQALLQLAATDDPHAADTPDIAGLSAIAALLAGRTGDAAAIADPALGASDEMVFWRGFRTAMMQEGAPAAASQFAATLPLLLSYPEAMQARLLPLVAETMVLGGQTAAAASLLARRPDDRALALARAMLLQVQGNTAGALAAYDSAAAGPDRLASARAGLRAAELRLASGATKPGEAADVEEKLIYAWRGDEAELALRLRIAALRADAGQWRQSLALLRESDALFGPQDKRFATALRDGFARLIHDDTADRLAPVELVALAEENADLLPDGPAGEGMATRLADRLDALDLPRRAEPVLEKLLRTTASPVARGTFGARLAKLRLAGSDPAGALAALTASAADGLSPPLVESRTLLTAAALAASGKPEDAVRLLAPLTSPAADEARAAVLEHMPDWRGAVAALSRYVDATVPADGTLDRAQTQAVLRLAGDAAQAGDESVLAGLRTRYGTRVTDAASAELFRMLTADPVRGLPDLARSGREVAAVRSLPRALQAISAAR